MQWLIRSKSAGVTGGRGTAGAGPGRDLLGPSGVDIAVHGLESSCSRIWWYPCFRSNSVKMRFFCCFCRMESISEVRKSVFPCQKVSVSFLRDA